MSDAFMIIEKGAYPFLRLTDNAFLRQCTCDVYAASGPGGQKRNRTYSAVRLTHRPTGLSACAEESRSQHVNRARTLHRLRLLLALRLRTGTENGWRLPEELLPYFRPHLTRMNPSNERYPLYCAALLDLMHRQRGSLSRTAQELGISTGQCGPLFAITKDLLAEANAIRAHFGLKPIRRD